MTNTHSPFLLLNLFLNVKSLPRNSSFIPNCNQWQWCFLLYSYKYMKFQVCWRILCPLEEKGAAPWIGSSNSSLGIVFLPVTAPPGPIVSTLLLLFVGWKQSKISQGRKSLNLNILTIVHFKNLIIRSLRTELHLVLVTSLEPHSPLTVRTALVWLVSTCPTYH